MGRARRTGSPAHPWVLLAALTVITLRGGAGSQETATEGKSQPTDATDTNDGGWEGHLWLRTLDEETAQSADTLSRSFLSRSPPDPEPGWNRTEEAGEASVVKATGNAAFGTAASQPETPINMSPFANNRDVDLTTVATSTAKTFSLEGSTLGYDPSGTSKDSGEPVPSQPMDGGLEALGAVTSIAWTPGKEVFALPATNTRKVARDAEDPEEAGSGDVHAILPESVLSHPHPGAKQQDQTAAVELPTPPPNQSANTEVKGLETRRVDQGISPDSAETDLLLGVHRDDVLSPPTPDGKSSSEAFEIQPEAEDRFGSDTDEDPSSLWEESTRKSVLQGAQRSTDLTALDKKGQAVPWMVTTSPPKTLKSTEAPSDPPVPDIIDIDYYDLFDIDGQGGPEDFPRSPGPGEDSTKKLHDKKPAWPLSELYDDFTPFDESDFYPTTSFYADGDEDGANQDEDDEDDIEVDDREEDEVTDKDLEDENSAKPLTFTPKLPTVAREEKPTSRQHVPHHTFILSGGDVNSKYQPDTNKDLTQMMAGDNGTECRTGYVRFNNSCKSVCDMYPMYCYNSGQCYLVENIGAFCRCNTQDYIWHKGLRCESIITDFQVMCVAVGAAALVVLLLFMMIVFFAKKLYLLKTENYKLRKRNRYRTPSELHNDNFSLSTIAEGSHPNEDSSAPNKLQEPPRSAPKEEEAFNIQNSLSLKAEGEKCQQDSPEVNCLQNNLT